VVQADARQRALLLQLLEADGPVAQRGGVGPHHHHLVADRLDDARVVGERDLDGGLEALDEVDRLLLPGLLGQPRVAREVDEGDRDAHAPQVEQLVRISLEMADDVLLDEVLQEGLVQVVHDRRRQRQRLAREPLHLLGHLEAGDAVADERLVHVEMEEADLGVGDLSEGLAVDADQLQEGHEREAGGEHRGDVAQQLQVVLGEPLEPVGGEAEGGPDALDQRGLEPGALGRLLEGHRGLGTGQQVLHVAVGEPAGARRAPDGLERRAAPAQPRHDPRVGDRGGRPAPVAQRDDAVADPAAQGRRLDVQLLRDRAERRLAHPGLKLPRAPGGKGTFR